MFTIFKLSTFIGAALSTLTLLFSFTGSAPQMAAGAAAACAMVVIPYAVAKLMWMQAQRKDTQAILAAIKAQRNPGAGDPHAS